eukprot:3160094-Pyramimonas_sp.AAC.1
MDAKKVHFANILYVSSVKRAQLRPELQICRGRVVVEGDNLGYESGLAAAFADAAPSASHAEASKLCDAAALLPGGGGERSDAPGACA